MANSYSKNKKNYKKAKETYKKLPVWAKVVAIILVLAIIGGAVYYYFAIYKKQKEKAFIPPEGSISFHFMQLGNDATGDCIFIQYDKYDILIDAGSKSNSVEHIKSYVDEYVSDNKFEFVIVTHSDLDHIAGFSKRDGSIFDLYDCETIIDFPLTNKSTTTDGGGLSAYGNYLEERNEEVSRGAKRYSALDCYNEVGGAKRVYNLSDNGNVKMEILYNYYYENTSTDENNYSVCLLFHHGSRQFLFTGDLEKEGEEELAKKYDFSEVELFKAGHHGSYTSSTKELLSEIKPKMSVVCCCAGSIERTTNHDRLFPSQDFVNRISEYTSLVYVPNAFNYNIPTGEDKKVTTSDNIGERFELNGNIIVVSEPEKDVYVDCSNNNTPLKDTDWFKTYRETPEAWLS